MSTTLTMLPAAQCCVCFNSMPSSAPLSTNTCVHYYATLCRDCKLSNLALENKTQCPQCRWTPPKPLKIFPTVEAKGDITLKFCMPDAEAVVVAFLKAAMHKDFATAEQDLFDMKKMCVILGTIVETTCSLQSIAHVFGNEFPNVFHYENVVGVDYQSLLELCVPSILRDKNDTRNAMHLAVPSYAEVGNDTRRLRKLLGVRIVALMGLWTTENGDELMRDLRGKQAGEEHAYVKSVARLCVKSGMALTFWRKLLDETRDKARERGSGVGHKRARPDSMV